MQTARTIAIVDDDATILKSLERLMRAEGFAVESFGSSTEFLQSIHTSTPACILLDLHMPETGGLDVARLVKAGATPSIAFVTAHDDFAIEAFELNAIDYLLKPVERERLASTLERARARAAATPAERARSLGDASAALESATRADYLERIPVRRKDETVILPVRLISSIVADGELLHLTTASSERFLISHRLHALEARLDPKRFVRLSRGTLASVDQIKKVTPMPGGTYQVLMANGETLQVSRIQSRLLRDTLLRL